MIADTTKLLDYTAAALALDCSEPTLRRLVRARKIRHYRVARGTIRFSMAQIEDFSSSREVQIAEPKLPQFPGITIRPLEVLRGMVDADILPGSGVYFLWRAESLVYVGQSEFISRRITQHRQAERDPTRRYIQFETATGFEVPWPYHLAVEAAYVRELQPSENRRK